MNEEELFSRLEDRLMNLASPGIIPGLARLSKLLALSGNPQNRFPAVHVVGTNGKGSTAATITSILNTAGYKTALYTSPHLVSFGERLSISGKPVAASRWWNFTEIAEKLIASDSYFEDNHPTYFELITAVAFMIIADENIDIAVVEAGLGGRLDATNILKNVQLSVVTPIGLDHTEYLGPTIKDIAAEKFAVMRKGADAVFAGGELEINRLFTEIARKKSVNAMIVCDSWHYGMTAVSPDGTDFYIENDSFSADYHTPLIGEHQAENAVLAIASACLLKKHFSKIDIPAIYNGVAVTNWPVRLEVISKSPMLILDGAHNSHAMKRLTDTLAIITQRGHLNVVMAMMKDKDIPSVLTMLAELNPSLYCTEIPGIPRSMKAEELALLASESGLNVISVHEDPQSALSAAVSKGSVTICCGSLYLVGYLKSAVKIIDGILEDNRPPKL